MSTEIEDAALQQRGALTRPSSEIEAERDARHKERSARENPFIFTIGDGLNRRSVRREVERKEMRKEAEEEEEDKASKRR